MNKKISQIEYNCLNLFPKRQYGLRLGNSSKLDCSRLAPYLPQRISYQDGSRVLYTYDAGGVKLRTDYYISPLVSSVPQVAGETGTAGTTLKHTWTDYCGNFIYENDSLKQILIDGGYITFRAPVDSIAVMEDSISAYTSNVPQYHFFVKDHLGNDRLVADENGNIEQINHYYPFGGLMGESQNLTSNQKYKYNGKELDRMHGLDWYDYGARNYDGMRFTTMDPMDEKYYNISPYAYCHDNPINTIDPNGKDDYRFDDDTGTFYLMKTTEDKTDRVLGYHIDKKTGQYEQNTKWYQTKTRIGNIEKGILKNEINFKQNDNVISVGGDGNPSVEGVKSFTLKLSELVGKEIAGFSYSSNTSGKVTDMVLGKYEKSELMESKVVHFNTLQKKYGNDFSFNNVLQYFHTHPNGELGATLSAPELSTDVETLKAMKPKIPNASFIVLYRITGQEESGEYDYTHEYNP
ncbi:MAG: RHS repeat-associated core domain-containing protein [Prevotella sp.]|nr:RHS repeat-associated core domain-containing protein [Prevotella sp.]